MSETYRVKYGSEDDADFGEYYEALIGPDGFKCVLTEPEDRTWGRDLSGLVDHLYTLRARAERLEGALRDLLGDVDGLINETQGVDGLHLNGDMAPWSELLDEGQFPWLHLEPARRALEGK